MCCHHNACCGESVVGACVVTGEEASSRHIEWRGEEGCKGKEIFACVLKGRRYVIYQSVKCEGVSM